ncbi:MAG: glycosyltransferase family 39 protein [Candidatus Omnitrophota bacterium]
MVVSDNLKKELPIWILTAAFLAIKVPLLFAPAYLMEWDEAVYMGIGKYLFSFGQAGLFEDFRPLGLPFFLGFFWKSGLSPLIFGRLLVTAFSAGLILVTYSVARSIYSPFKGLLAAAILITSPLFLFYSDRLYTEIPSTFFVMLALYAFVKNKAGWAGALAGLGFLTKFPQGLILVVFLLVLFLERRRDGRDFFRQALVLLGSFAVVVMPYFIFNFLAYSRPQTGFFQALFLPLVHARQFESSVVTGDFLGSFEFYILGPVKDHGILIFAFARLISLFSRGRLRTFEEKTGFLYAVLFFMYFAFIPHKEMRYWQVIFPIFAVFASDGLWGFFESLKVKKLIRHPGALALAVFCLLLFLRFVHFRADLTSGQGPLFDRNEILAARYQYLDRLPVSGAILTTHPWPCAYTDKLFVPFFMESGQAALSAYQRLNKEHAVGGILIPLQGFPCEGGDELCQKSNLRLLEQIKKNRKAAEGNNEAFYLLAP